MKEALEPGTPKYRPDIDGLRGIAVLAVVLFHAFPESIRGGFVGVDVFFVISGFLIAAIILGGLKEGHFRFREFYARRIRRIFPALVVILAAVAVVGWFLYDARAYAKLGRHVLGGATFSSNFMLWQESGYFDVAGERKALLHLWSLAIEEQFYLLFPFMLWAAHKRRIGALPVIASVGLGSFAWNVLLIARDPSATFYAPQTRAWELMLGAALAAVAFDPPARLSAAISWFGERRSSMLASILGIVLLIGGFILIEEKSAFPGWWALLPTVGTALLIAAGPRIWINRRLLAWRPLGVIGLISYPLYLWHWPLLSVSRVVAGGPLPAVYRAAMIIAAFVLAWMTYRFIERPARFGKIRDAVTRGLPVALLMLGAVGLSIWWGKGFVSRPVARTYEGYLQSVKFGDGGCVPIDDGFFCRIGDPAAVPIAVIYGDSHAGVLRPAFAKYASETGRSFLFAKAGPPLLGLICAPTETAERAKCEDRNQRIYAYVKKNAIRHVILVARWRDYEGRQLRLGPSVGPAPEGRIELIQEGFRRTIAAYGEIGVGVHAIADNPLQMQLPEDILRQSQEVDDESINMHAIARGVHAMNEGPMTDLLRSTAGEAADVWDFTDAYCHKDICPLVKGGKFLYADHDHLSIDGTMQAYPELKKRLDTIADPG